MDRTGGSPEGGRAGPAPLGAPPREPSLVEAEALADPTRHRLFRILRAADAPMTVAELTDAVGVHHTAVRQHLARLRSAGLIAEERSAASGRGRPPMRYRAAGPEVVRSEEAYRRLALLLARAVRTGESPREVGRDEGREAAAVAVAHRPPAEGPADPVEVVFVQAERLGFRPVRDGDDVELRNCPFRDVAAIDPATVCALHLGMAEGVVEAVGGAEVTGLEVRDPDRAGCRITLRRDPPG